MKIDIGHEVGIGIDKGPSINYKHTERREGGGSSL